MIEKQAVENETNNYSRNQKKDEDERQNSYNGASASHVECIVFDEN